VIKPKARTTAKAKPTKAKAKPAPAPKPKPMGTTAESAVASDAEAVKYLLAEVDMQSILIVELRRELEALRDNVEDLRDDVDFKPL